MGKYKHKNGQVGSGVALNMIKANSNAPFELGGQKGVGKDHMDGPLLQSRRDARKHDAFVRKGIKVSENPDAKSSPRKVKAMARKYSKFSTTPSNEELHTVSGVTKKGYNPTYQQAIFSSGPEQRGKKLQKKITKLSDKHKGLHDAVVEGHGQNEYTSGNYDKDMKKLHKVEDRLEKKEKKYQEKFGESPYGHSISDEMKNATREWVKNSVNSISPTGPRMEGPLNKQKRFDKTVSKAEEALEKGNYRKAFRKGKSLFRQADKQGLINKEDYEKVNFKTWKSDRGLSMKGPLNAGCAKSAGGPGCVEKRGSEYVIINNKKPGNQIWRSGFPSRKAANDNLAGYHASK